MYMYVHNPDRAPLRGKCTEQMSDVCLCVCVCVSGKMCMRRVYMKVQRLTSSEVIPGSLPFAWRLSDSRISLAGFHVRTLFTPSLKNATRTTDYTCVCDA